MLSADVTHAIETAIRDRQVLRVTYRALDDEVGRVEIEPLAIRFNTTSHRVLWCWRRDAGHIEELLWDGIEDAVPTGETFAARPWTESQT